MPYYDPRTVPAHGNPKSTVFLVNEAPGPCEAHYAIPLVAAQGGNIYRSFRKAKISWATNFNTFPWPVKIRKNYTNPNKKLKEFRLRNNFLGIRKEYVTCTNAYNLWPRSSPTKNDWVNPEQNRVNCLQNRSRLSAEIPKEHKVILICGEFAWLACLGQVIQNPASKEGNKLTPSELATVNNLLSSHFTDGWYMGHTRRWSFNSNRITSILNEVSSIVGW